MLEQHTDSVKTIRTKFGGLSGKILIALNGLADDGYRASKSMPWGIEGYLEVLIQLQIKITGGAPAGDKNCLVYAYGTAHKGSPFSGGANGQDSSYGGKPGQLIANCSLLGIVTVDAVTEVFTSDVFSIASAFGGEVPAAGGIIVMNQTGRTLASTQNLAWFQGLHKQV